MKNLILTVGIFLLGAVAMAQTTTPVAEKNNEKNNSVSTLARETESAKGKGQIVSAEARQQKAQQQVNKEKRAELKAANVAPQSEEAKALAETKRATADTRSKTDKARPAYAGQGAAAAKSVRLFKPVKPSRPVRG